MHWDNKRFISIIPLFTQLIGLNASLCNLDDDCLNCFKGMSNLKVINISGNRFNQPSLHNFLQYASSRELQVIY